MAAAAAVVAVVVWAGCGQSSLHIELPSLRPMGQSDDAAVTKATFGVMTVPTCQGGTGAAVVFRADGKEKKEEQQQQRRRARGVFLLGPDRVLTAKPPLILGSIVVTSDGRSVVDGDFGRDGDTWCIVWAVGGVCVGGRKQRKGVERMGARPSEAEVALQKLKLFCRLCSFARVSCDRALREEWADQHHVVRASHPHHPQAGGRGCV